MPDSIWEDLRKEIDAQLVRFSAKSKTAAAPSLV
jgi:hypothetical protein